MMILIDASTFIMRRRVRGKACNCNSSDLEPAPKIMAHNGMHTAALVHFGTIVHNLVHFRILWYTLEHFGTLQDTL